MASNKSLKLDSTKLRNFENAAAGHDGVLSDESGEIVVKPCTQAEIDFYQESLSEHPKFYEMMPEFFGVLSLNEAAEGSDPAAAQDPTQLARNALHGSRVDTETAVVLENLEYGFKRANVLDIKLGAKLYREGTRADKAERLDKVSAETTSGSLNFRIAGMKVWNGQSYDIYDKMYGRRFDRDNVRDGFATFFSGLSTNVSQEHARQLLETVLAEVTKVRHSLERSESRMFSASILVVYEGDVETLDALIGGEPVAPRVDEVAPTYDAIKKSEEEEGEEEDVRHPLTHRVKMIDFAHAAWTPGQGRDENVIRGLKNIEDQLDLLIARFE